MYKIEIKSCESPFACCFPSPDGGSCTADSLLTKTFTLSSHFLHIVSPFAQDGFF